MKAYSNENDDHPKFKTEPQTTSHN